MRRSASLTAGARALAVALAAVVVAGVVSCSTTGTGSESGRVTILAAASLADVMPELVDAEQERHPDRTYEVSYAGSSAIIQQLNAGAWPDAVVLAGEGPLAALDPDVERSGVETVATNTLVVALAAGNPGDIDRLADLARDDVTLVVCAVQVPCGEAAQRVFDRAGLVPEIASYEPDVRATLSKVTSEEADAALVYVTDVAGDRIETVPLPPEVAVSNRYPAFSVGGSEAGEDFVDLLGSAQAGRILRDAGFGVP